MSSGIQWIADRDDWTHDIIFARGITPEELGTRLGGLPGSIPSPITGHEAWDRVLDLGTEEESVVLVGTEVGWAFAVVYGFADVGDRLPDVTTHGAEAIHLAPAWDDPPVRFSYAEDGSLVCFFGIGEEVWREGSRPDLLLSELVDAGVLHADGTYAWPEDSDHRDRDRNTLAVIERRFGISLSRSDVENGRLPAYVIP